MNLTVIMVNYKSDKNKLNSCLKSINIKTKVLIVDHSNDLKSDQIFVPENISLEIINNKNLGNGAGINCGIKNAKTKYVLYLDIDTILPENFFITLEDAVNKIDKFAVIAPKINNFYDDNRISVEDNGPGIPTEVTSSDSHGLSIIEERLDLLSKKYSQTFEKRIEPLAESTLSTGTCVSLILPADFGH